MSMTPAATSEIIERIEDGLRAAVQVLMDFTPGNVASETKAGGDLVSAADHAVDRVLKQVLLRDSEGWLSEETVDNHQRLECRRVWIVDPLDGTREFLAGIPEWSISIGYVEDGTPVAGGICNPQTGESVVGGLGHGVVLNGEAVVARSRHTLDGALVLASRSEFRRGEWSEFKNMPFEVRPVGSVAYKLACVAGGLADATWTLQPKNEWDVAAGVALIRAVGGVAYTPSGESPTFNNRDTLMTGLIAHSDSLTAAVRSTLGIG